MNPTEQLERVYNELLCSICCDYFVRAFTMSCSHSFCYNCIVEWRKNNGNCPICRESIYNMAPSRALDNMVVALNDNTNRINVDSEGLPNTVVESPVLEILSPSTSFESIIVNDDQYNAEWIESDSTYISDIDSFSNDEFGDDCFDTMSLESNMNNTNESDVSRNSLIILSSSSDNDDLLDSDYNDSNSTVFSFSGLSTGENMTIRHTIDFG